MGRPRRQRIRLFPILKQGLKLGLKQRWAALVLAVLLAGCSGGSLDAADMLLGPSDFPGIEITESATQQTVTPQGVSAAQVQISGPDFQLSHSVVLFATPASALSVLAGIKQDQLAQGFIPSVGLSGVTPGGPSGTDQFQDTSGVLIEVRDGQETLTVFLVEGRALIRLTVLGPGAQSMLATYAEIARSKASRQ